MDAILERCRGRRVLVVGDAVLDEYLHGDVRRVSPEAPVPVVELRKRRCVPGGAANAAANAAELDAQVRLLGVVGDDDHGRELAHAVKASGVDAAGLLVDTTRPTTTKTRVVAHAQQVVRVDRESRQPLPAEVEDELSRRAEVALGWCDVCVLSDYAKGVVSPALARRVIDGARRLGRPVVVDPKGGDAAKYRGATLVKPNLHEAGVLLRRELSGDDLHSTGAELLTLLEASCVLVTRGSAGMSLYLRDGGPVRVAAHACEVFDVTGAGDTVAATLAVALAAGATFEQAARLANRAASIVVGKVGTAAITLEALRRGLAHDPDALPDGPVC